MKKLLLLAGLLFCLVSPTLTRAAHADTITTFTLTGTTANPQYSGIGSFTVNTTTGVVQSADFNIQGGNPNLVREPFQVFPATQYGFTEIFLAYDSPVSSSQGFYSIDIYVPVTSFVGYTGGFICSVAHPCDGNSNVYQSHTTSYFQNGQLTAVAVTPEPSSLSYLLLSVVCVGSVPFLRKRILQNCA